MPPASEEEQAAVDSAILLYFLQAYEVRVNNILRSTAGLQLNLRELSSVLGNRRQRITAKRKACTVLKVIRFLGDEGMSVSRTVVSAAKDAYVADVGIARGNRQFRPGRVAAANAAS